LLPDGPRQSSRSGSALDFSWLDGLDPAEPILVTAQGLLPYFQRDQVHGLISAIAERLPGSQLVFDVVPDTMLDIVRRTSGRERDLAVQWWTWLYNGGEHAAVGAIPGVRELLELAPARGRDATSLVIAVIARLPWRLRYSVPVIHVLKASFGAASVQ
jgi:hypothetical protein